LMSLTMEILFAPWKASAMSKRDWLLCRVPRAISKLKSWILGRSSRAKKRLTRRLRLWGKNKQAPMNRKSPLFDRAYYVQPQMKLPYSRYVIMQDLGKKRPKYRRSEERRVGKER